MTDLSQLTAGERLLFEIYGSYPENTTEKEDTMSFETRKFVRKPFEVEAIQVNDANMQQLATWCGGTVEVEGGSKYVHVKVHKPQSVRQTKAFVGDWLLFAGTGFKVYTPRAFEKSFEDQGTTVVHTEDEVAADQAAIEKIYGSKVAKAATSPSAEQIAIQKSERPSVASPSDLARLAGLSQARRS